MTVSELMLSWLENANRELSVYWYVMVVLSVCVYKSLLPLNILLKVYYVK